MVSHYFMFMQGTPQQEVAYAATLLRANAHDWFMAYLRKNQGRYPRDWATMSAALVDRFGSRLRDRQALAELMVMRQNRRNVREFAADFENCVGKLTSSDENTLMQMFLWALDRDLAEKVALAHPKSLQSASRRTWSLQSALLTALWLRAVPQHHRQEWAPRLTPGADSRRNGVEDAGELGVGDVVVAVRANGEVDPVQAGVDG